jgi:hypothetical protein
MARLMPEPSASSVPAITTTPRIFCKGCGYALVGLQSTQCPECGRGFDLGNRRTFARRPPRRALWRWGRRLLAVVLLLLLTAGAGMGWLWRGWRAEQPTIAWLQALGQRVAFRPIGPERLQWVLGKRFRYLLDRVGAVRIGHLRAAQTEQLDFSSFPQMEVLLTIDCELSGSNLSKLAGLQKLRQLQLYSLRIEKPNLAFLQKLPALSELYLSGNWFPHEGYEHFRGLKQLKKLEITRTEMNDADLQQLHDLPSLKELILQHNLITYAGLEHLQVLGSMRHLAISRALFDSSGAAKLKQAFPGVKIDPLDGG